MTFKSIWAPEFLWKIANFFRQSKKNLIYVDFLTKSIWFCQKSYDSVVASIHVHQPECKDWSSISLSFKSGFHINSAIIVSLIYFEIFLKIKKIIKEKNTFGFISSHIFWFKCSFFSKSSYTWLNWVPQHLLFDIITCNLIHITVRLIMSLAWTDWYCSGNPMKLLVEAVQKAKTALAVSMKHHRYWICL